MHGNKYWLSYWDWWLSAYLLRETPATLFKSPEMCYRGREALETGPLPGGI
jgi:hypothetical protein